MIIFGIVASIIWGILHVYAGFRLFRAPRVEKPWKFFGWGLIGADFLVSVLAFSFRRTVDASWVNVIEWIAYVSMGAFVLLLSLVLARDLIHFSTWFGRHLVQKIQNRQGHDSSRRHLLTGSVNLGIFALTGAGTAVGFEQARNTPDVERVDVPVEGLHPDLDGLTIAQVSDIHLGPTIKRAFLERVVDVVNDLDVDLVAVTGDLVDGYVSKMGSEIEPLRRMRARHGKFFVTGNHEYYWGPEEWCEEVGRNDVTVLVDEHRIVEVSGAKLLVAGVADYSAGRFEVPGHESDPARAREGALPHDFSILLAHQPKNIYGAADAGFDLQLSGHTHGGQFYPWNFFVGLAHPFTAGLGKHEDRTWIYVSRGTGYWGPPLRLGVPSEITLLTLRPA